jgi:drug/metabolite transporter (DMT)-like permease
MTRPLGRLLLLGALTVFWGGNWPALKLAVREIDPWKFRTLCLLLGGGALLALVRAGGQSLAVPRRERGPLCLVTVFNITAWHLLSAYGLMRIQAGRGAIIAYTMPIWTVAFGWLLLGERLTTTKAVALVLGTAGLAVLVGRDMETLWAAPAGVILMLGAAIVWALGTLLIKSFRWTIPTATLTGWQLVLGAVPIALGALARLGWGSDNGGLHALTHLSPGALAGAAYATFVGVTFCHWAWFKLVGALPAAVAAIGVLGTPVVGVFSSALVIGEPVGAAELAAVALVVSGLAILLGGPGK